MPLSADVMAQDVGPTPRFWGVIEAHHREGEKIEAQLRERLSISIINLDEAHALLDRFRHRGNDRSYLLSLPPEASISIELEMRVPGYAPDYFFETGFHFVSARFRQAANFPDGVVKYLDAPCLRCTPEAKARDYKAMWVNGFADALDREQSTIVSPERFPERSTYVFSEKLAPSAPIFQLGLYGWVMMTDAAARRLAAERLDGVAFCDITHYRADGQFVRMDD